MRAHCGSYRPCFIAGISPTGRSRRYDWGHGRENPSIFNPTALDADQWVRAMKGAGGKMVILVSKHHDGFCMWPTRYTPHSVAASPWLGGKSEVVRAVADAARAADLRARS